uniref:Uncharacterized protein n=1 Tax=Oryza glumipatula TaxID=40148 RepID=A0A0E0AG70_9ORYZ
MEYHLQIYWSSSKSLGICDGDSGDSSLLRESPLQSSCTCAANCRFHSTSSTDGLCTASLARHLRQISITVFTDSSEHPLLTAGSTKLLLFAVPSAVSADCSCSKNTDRMGIL